MFRSTTTPTCGAALLLLLSGSIPALAQYAESVISYNAGTTPASAFTVAAAALGEPSRFTGGSFPGVVSPFSPPFRTDQIVSVGEGGQITLRLSNYAIPHPAGPEIGLFENIGIVDVDFPNGHAGSPAATFGPLDSALVEVSGDGASWVSLGSVLFDIPTNGFTDLDDPFSPAPGSVPSNFQQPFIGSLSDFDGLPYSDNNIPDILELLNGSGGGTWIDISGSGLARVGYVRLSLADDGNSGVGLNFELDAVSIARGSVGGIVPEPMSITLLGLALASVMMSCRRSRPAAE